VTIALVTWFDAMPPGALQGVMINTDDIDAEHARLSALGLQLSEIGSQPWGRYAMFQTRTATAGCSGTPVTP
jgi:hypothetical protein